MSKKSVIMCVLSVIMAAYIVFALVLTHRMASEATLNGKVEVRLSDPTSQFVTVDDVMQELGFTTDTLGRVLRDRFDLHGLEERLLASDKLQNANANLMSDGTIVIDVDPMVPVARVFEPGKPSYYINTSGKRISADLRYHIDVPVLVGSFDSVHPAQRLLPLLDYIASNPSASAIVATVTQESDGNIILIPTIVGHVINFGDTTLVADKFRRLRAFYRHVAPTQGWETYDTIAVKWRNQVVGTRRHKIVRAVAVPTEEEQTGFYDIDNNEPKPDETEQENTPQ